MGEKKHNGATVPQAETFQGLFDYLNDNLFDGQLRDCMLMFSRNANVIGGYFSPDKWYNEETGQSIHEIGLNANILTEQGFIDIVDTITHEMIHLEQWLNGTPGRMGYHNKEFMARCDQLGLDTAGKGQTVSTRVRSGGDVERVALEMPDSLLFDWMANPLDIPGAQGQAPEPGTPPPKPKKSGKRSVYQCPQCGMKLWGKGGLTVLCGECDRRLVEGV
jgi:hypothetical protein